MPGLLSGKTLRRGGSGQFIDLKGAQPQLPPSPSTSTGFTLVTNDKLVTTYSSSLGNLEFTSATIYSNNGKNLQLLGTDSLAVVVLGGTETTSTNTGALVVQGGIGVWGNVYIGGQLVTNVFTATTATIYNLTITSTETSISTSTGALVVAGGVGIGDNINVGTTLDVKSTATFETDVFVKRDVTIKRELTVDGTGAVTLSPQAANVDIRPTAGGGITIQSGDTGGHIDNMIIGYYVPKDSHFLNSYADNFIGLATTATNIEKGALGSIPYQTDSGKTDFIGIGPERTVLTSNGTTATWKKTDDIFVGTATSLNHYIILSTATNNYGTLAEDSDFYYSPNFKELYVQTINANQSIYSREGIVEENNLLYTPRSTLSIGTPPVSPRLGDFWIDPSQGATFQYMLDGTNKVWVQFTGL